jgi:cobalt/nickel transport system permease protein
MHHDYLDRFARIESPVHRLRAEFKLGSALVLLLTTILIPLGAGSGMPAASRLAFAVIALVLSFGIAMSRVPILFLARRLAFLELFVAGVAVLSLFQPGGGRVFAGLLVRGTLCLLTVLMLTSTTPFSEILRVFRRIRLPAILVTMMALLYRYLFVLVDEAERMDRARASRTFSRRRSRLWCARAGVLGQLFVRSTIRAERIYSAMCARGWKS